LDSPRCAPPPDPTLYNQLEGRVRQRTGGRVRDLRVEVRGGRVLLRGRSATYYAKQLAQHGVLDVMPGVGLDNAIAVGAA
jgi:hypothetical protein